MDLKTLVLGANGPGKLICGAFARFAFAFEEQDLALKKQNEIWSATSDTAFLVGAMVNIGDHWDEGTAPCDDWLMQSFYLVFNGIMRSWRANPGTLQPG